jgi:hypothetical protein
LCGRFARADPAALFAAFDAFGLRKTLLAMVPTFFDVV